jgi:hypothetical protein
MEQLQWTMGSADNRSTLRNPHVGPFVKGEVNIWLQYRMAVSYRAGSCRQLNNYYVRQLLYR